MKRPSFQFYPGDWLRDTALRSCSIGARGLWIDMLCLMHDSDRYGHLQVNGRPISADALARIVGCSVKEAKAWLAELEDCGVCSRTDDGVLFSRRMVRDEQIRERRAEGGKAGAEHGAKGGLHGAKGGRPRGVNNPPSGEAKGGFEPPSYPPPSSSSSSSSKNPIAQTTTLSPREPQLGRALELAALLRGRGALLNATDPRLIEWVEHGVTDAQALTALDTAERQRTAKRDTSPINCGYLDGILRNQLAEAARPKVESIHDRRAKTIHAMTGGPNADRSDPSIPF